MDIPFPTKRSLRVGDIYVKSHETRPFFVTNIDEKTFCYADNMREYGDSYDMAEGIFLRSNGNKDKLEVVAASYFFVVAWGRTSDKFGGCVLKR